jgi:hypothetical protein
MKTWKRCFILITLISIIKTESSGVKISLDENFLKESTLYFSPPILKKMENISLPELAINIDLTIGTIYMTLTNILFQIDNLTPEDIDISLTEPNKIHLKLKNVKGKGHFDANIVFWKIFKENDKVDFNILSLDFTGDLEMVSQESSIDKGKMLPSAVFSDVVLNVDFDFDIKGSIFAKLASIFKTQIKNTIKTELQTKLKDTLIEKSKVLISGLIANQTVYYNIYENIGVDISLASKPVVSNKYFSLYPRGAVVDMRNKNSSPYDLNEISEASMNKSIHLGIGSYSINTAILTLFNSGLLKLNVTTDSLDQFLNSSIKLNTTTLDVFINNLSKVYGLDKKVMFEFEFMKAPILNINKDSVNSTLNIMGVLSVETNQSTYTEAIRFSTNFFFNANATLENGGLLNAYIYDFDLDNSQIISSNVEGVESLYVEQLLDFILDAVAPVLNKNYLKNVKVDLSLIEGLNIDDSSANIEEGFIKLSSCPKFSKEFIDKVIKIIEKLLDGLKTKKFTIYYKVNLLSVLREFYTYNLSEFLH